MENLKEYSIHIPQMSFWKKFKLIKKLQEEYKQVMYLLDAELSIVYLPMFAHKLHLFNSLSPTPSTFNRFPAML